MQAPYVHTRTTPANPGAYTLARMGRTASGLADTWTFREWAARLATKARPRDYVGQLRQLYDGVLKRWRYVQEPDEWIHGTPRSAIAHVLGVKYNAPHADPTRVRLDKIPTREKGFGDCDDVSEIVAGGVKALGMVPFFRVARGDRGAHVSVVARTPGGDMISIDPVGHPKHPFGWSLPASSVELYGMDGEPVSTLMLGSIDNQPQTQGMPMHALSGEFYGTGTDRTYFSGFSGDIERGPSQPGHWCAVPMGDVDGPRVLAMPMRYHRLFKRGIAVDGAHAIDEHGKQYRYNAPRDLWLHSHLWARGSRLNGLPEAYGGIRDWFRRIGRRIRKRFAGVRRFFRRVGRGIRNVVSKIMSSRVAQNIVGGILQAYGVPRRLTMGVMAAAAHIIRAGGLIGFIRLLRRDRRKAMQLVAQAARAGLQRARAMFGPEVYGPTAYRLTQGGRTIWGQPVVALAGVPGLVELGDLEIQSAATPGYWYQVKKGDTLFGVAQRAYGLKSTDRKAIYERAKWMNAAAANQPIFDPRNTDNTFPKGKISASPRWSCNPELASKGAPGKCFAPWWIPLTKGDEPESAVPEPPPGPAPEFPPMEPPPVVPPQIPVEPLPPPAPPPSVHEKIPDVPPPIAPPMPPKESEVMAACKKTGGQWVEYMPGKKGCVHCEGATVWSQAAGKCVTPVDTTPPPRTIPPSGPTRQQQCADAGGVWRDGACYTPGMCRPGFTFDTHTGECHPPLDVPAPPTRPPLPPEIEPLPPLPPPVVPPTTTGTGHGFPWWILLAL